MSDIDGHHLRLLEALIFASSDPVPLSIMADRLPDGADLEALIEALRDHYAERGVNFQKIGKGWAFRTAHDLAQQLTVERKATRKLSRAAVETLSIVAYHQPVTRAEVEEIRGVGLSKGTMDVLFEAGWIRPRGRRRTPGRPVTWGTTEEFLDHFALESLDDLPGQEDLKAAGLLDKRPAVQTLGTRALPFPMSSNDDEEGAGEEDDEDDFSDIEPLDPDDGDQLAEANSD
ncbi:MAG: SMC-Scp complex subunit ScpB [Rhodospirillales bacterium]|nr:SMC-Scp complex subunit ScpB [Rhodospirillales bacterium]